MNRFNIIDRCHCLQSRITFLSRCMYVCMYRDVDPSWSQWKKLLIHWSYECYRRKIRID